jgi:hypothetical protein
MSRFATPSDYYRLLIRNSGNKTARDVYWRIFFVDDAGSVQPAGGRDLGLTTLDGIVHRQLAGSLRKPVCPTRAGAIVALKVARTAGSPNPVTIRWVLVSEDGRVPEDETRYGTLIIDSTAAQVEPSA